MILPEGQTALEVIYPMLDASSIESQAIMLWLKENQYLFLPLVVVTGTPVPEAGTLIQFGMQVGFAVARFNGWKDK